jgi:phosphoglycerate dehydrogenase-like enzyme
MDADELVRRAEGADVLVTLYTYTQIGAAVLERLPRVKLVATRTAGFSHIDVECAARLGVRVAVVPSAATRSVAEYVFGALLAAQRGLFAARDATRAGSWAYQSHQGFELSGSTLGVVGLGAIGTQVAEIGGALGMHVLGWTRRAREINGVEMVELDTLLRQADVVSLSVALNDETRGLLGQRELALMKPSAWIVNAARGGILDEDDLVERLRAGTIAGAILDVLDGEPPSAEGCRCRGRCRRHGRGPAECRRRACRLPRDRRANERRLWRELWRIGRPSVHAEQLRLRRLCGEY